MHQIVLNTIRSYEYHPFQSEHDQGERGGRWGGRGRTMGREGEDDGEGGEGKCLGGDKTY